MSQSEALREALQKRFYPFVQERGFVRGKATSLFAPFERLAGENIQFFEIQWDKYHHPRFVINFGEFANSESRRSVVRISSGRLQRWRGGSMRTWFQISKPWSESLRTFSWSYQPDEVVNHLIECFPELEAWWSSKQEGPHVYIFRQPIG